MELPERHELRKLQQLKEEAGEMTAADERKLRGLQRATEKEILQAADVVCVTCVGAGDLRLNNFRFRQVHLAGALLAWCLAASISQFVRAWFCSGKLPGSSGSHHIQQQTQ